MRPAGDVSQALLSACRRLATDGRGVTLQELAQAACIGQDAARSMVPALKRRGHLEIVGERQVAYRNRPVALYAPAVARDGVGHLALAGAMAVWAGVRNA